MQFVLLFKTISSDCPRNTSSVPSSWWITPIGIIADLSFTSNSASGTILSLSIMAAFINRGAESRFIIRSGRNGNKSHLPSGRADSEQIWRPSATFFCVGQGLWHGRHGVGCVEDSSQDERIAVTKVSHTGKTFHVFSDFSPKHTWIILRWEL